MLHIHHIYRTAGTFREKSTCHLFLALFQHRRFLSPVHILCLHSLHSPHFPRHESWDLPESCDPYRFLISCSSSPWINEVQRRLTSTIFVPGNLLCPQPFLDAGRLDLSISTRVPSAKSALRSIYAPRRFPFNIGGASNVGKNRRSELYDGVEALDGALDISNALEQRSTGVPVCLTSFLSFLTPSYVGLCVSFPVL